MASFQSKRKSYKKKNIKKIGMFLNDNLMIIVLFCLEFVLFSLLYIINLYNGITKTLF